MGSEIKMHWIAGLSVLKELTKELSSYGLQTSRRADCIQLTSDDVTGVVRTAQQEHVLPVLPGINGSIVTGFDVYAEPSRMVYYTGSVFVGRDGALVPTKLYFHQDHSLPSGDAADRQASSFKMGTMQRVAYIFSDVGLAPKLSFISYGCAQEICGSEADAPYLTEIYQHLQSAGFTRQPSQDRGPFKFINRYEQTISLCLSEEGKLNVKVSAALCASKFPLDIEYFDQLLQARKELVQSKLKALGCGLI